MAEEREAVAIEIDPESELGLALAAAGQQPVTEEDLWKDYDPERVRVALREAAGSLTPDEAGRLKEMIYRGREEGTRPIDRP